MIVDRDTTFFSRLDRLIFSCCLLLLVNINKKPKGERSKKSTKIRNERERERGLKLEEKDDLRIYFIYIV